VELRTERLLLRPLVPADAVAIEPLINDWEVAATTTIPHPYPAGTYEAFIRHLAEQWRAGTNYGFAIVPTESGTPIGSMNLLVGNGTGELAYWIGRPYWGRGYATEAGARVVRFGFEELQLPAIIAVCLARNVGSIRVLEKIGLQHREHRPASIAHYGQMEDGESFNLASEDWRTTLAP